MASKTDEINRLWCGKRTYPDMASAMRAARGINDRTNGKAAAYYCKVCESFHFGRKATRANISLNKSPEDNVMIHAIETKKASLPPIVQSTVKETNLADRELSWLAQRVAKGRDAPFSEIATITSTIAKHLLEQNIDNRPLSEMQVNQIAHDIKAGHWELNGETIIVAKDGTLNDGQNRLAAVVQSGIPIQTAIMFGVSRSSRMTVDMGRQRSGGNFMAMQGIKYANETASATGLFLRYKAGIYATGGTKILARIFTKQDILAGYQLHEKQIKAAVALVANEKFAVLVGKQALATAHIILTAKNPVEATVFFARLMDGSNLKRNDPILWLRARLLDVRKERIHAYVKLELILRTWNAWREGKSLMRHIKVEGCYPEVSR